MWAAPLMAEALPCLLSPLLLADPSTLCCGIPSPTLGVAYPEFQHRLIISSTPGLQASSLADGTEQPPDSWPPCEATIVGPPGPHPSETIHFLSSVLLENLSTIPHVKENVTFVFEFGLF